jgi:hypothetical protein
MEKYFAGYLGGELKDGGFGIEVGEEGGKFDEAFVDVEAFGFVRRLELCDRNGTLSKDIFRFRIEELAFHCFFV